MSHRTPTTSPLYLYQVTQTCITLTNTSLDTQKPFEPLTIACPQHPTELITNYCTNLKCLMPLCPDCIEPHLDEHKRSQLFPEIQAIKNSRVKCIKKLQKLSEGFVQQLNTIEAPKSIDRVCSDTISRLSQIKVYMMQSIENYFMSLEEAVKVKVNETAALLKDLEVIHSRMRKILEELATLDDNLHSNSPATTPTIRKVFSLDANGLNDSFMAELDNYNGSRKRTDVEISFDQSTPTSYYVQNLRIDKFKQLLSEVVRVDRSTTSGLSTPNSYSKANTMYQTNNNPIAMSRTVQESRLRTPMAPPVDYSGVQIKDPYRPTKPLLHFFESGSKNLHLISVPSLEKRVVPLRMSQNVPHFHKSILTTTGDIILTGGTIEQTGEKNKLISKYEVDRQIFTESFARAIERSSHSLCQCEGSIYIIGGFGKEGGERIVERLNPRTGEVERESTSKYGGPNLSIYLNASRSILKLSQQGVEVYNVSSKMWKQVHIPQFYYYEMCAGAQVNDNQVMIFGGYSGQDQGGKGVRVSYLLDVSDRQNISLVPANGFDLPVEEGFWNNIPLVFRKEVYALQNVESAESADCLENRRRLLKFNGVKWDVLAD